MTDLRKIAEEAGEEAASRCGAAKYSAGMEWARIGASAAADAIAAHLAAPTPDDELVERLRAAAPRLDPHRVREACHAAADRITALTKRVEEAEEKAAHFERRHRTACEMAADALNNVDESRDCKKVNELNHMVLRYLQRAETAEAALAAEREKVKGLKDELGDQHGVIAHAYSITKARAARIKELEVALAAEREKVKGMETAAVEAKRLLSYANQTSASAAVAEGNRNAAWHVLDHALAAGEEAR